MSGSRGLKGVRRFYTIPEVQNWPGVRHDALTRDTSGWVSTRRRKVESILPLLDGGFYVQTRGESGRSLAEPSIHTAKAMPCSTNRRVS